MNPQQTVTHWIEILPGIGWLTAGLCAWLPCMALAGELVWSEEFNSGDVPDSTVWSYDLGSSGWGNAELQNYTDRPENARIKDGALVITVLEESSGGASFSSARIRTQDKVTFKYGTIEARIKMPDLANGLWPAFWTLGNSFSEVGWPACGELDIVEMGSGTAIAQGVVNRRVGSTAHWEHEGTHASYGLHLDAAADLDDDYHIFRMTWTPEKVETFLDGTPVWVMEIDSANCTDCTEFHEPHFIILNVAVGGNYPGIHTPSGIAAPLPGEMRVDYVRIYDDGNTEMGGSAIDAANPVIGPAHSGSWYNPAQSGHGFSLEFGPDFLGNPLAVAYWFAYDDQGNPMFMMGTGTPEGNRVEIDLVSPVGMVFGEFDPDSVTREDGGTLVFEFSDRDNGVFSYTPSEFSSQDWGHSAIEAMPITRLFGVPAPAGFELPK